MGVPVFNASILGHLGPLIPVSTIILLLEHIAISKSFGRINNYKIDPNQELIAMGVTNVIGPFFGAYPATGSFSRSAIKSKAGVRTPIAGWITGLVVIVALYALTGAFYWIPNAGLSAVIIHAVGDLIASPRQVYMFWKVSPIEAIIFFGAVVITIFTTIEIGIYVRYSRVSLALVALPLAALSPLFCSLVLTLSLLRRPLSERALPSSSGALRSPVVSSLAAFASTPTSKDPPTPASVTSTFPSTTTASTTPPPRSMLLPLVRRFASALRSLVTATYWFRSTGVVVYRMEDAFTYPNASRYVDDIQEYIKTVTRSGINYGNIPQGDRPWNNPGPNRWSKKEVILEGELSASEKNDSKPLLRAVVLDFAGVAHVDVTSVQNLVDLRRVLERYADGPVAFEFASIRSPWIKR